MVVASLAHLARSLPQLAAWFDAFTAHGVMLQSAAEGIDTSRDGEALRRHVHQLVKWEREVIRERTCTGLLLAREQGKLIGCPRRLTTEELDEAERRLRLGETHEAVARALGVSRSTLYRALNSHGCSKLSKERG